MLEPFTVRSLSSAVFTRVVIVASSVYGATARAHPAKVSIAITTAAPNARTAGRGFMRHLLGMGYQARTDLISQR
jgi:hypothetical protein